MIMLENQDIHGSILAIMESMRLQGASPGRLKNFETAYNVFEQYLSDNSITEIDESLCLEYVYAKTGQRFERFECVTSNARVDYRMRPLLLLLRYLQDGQFHSDVRKTKPSFVCLACFKSEYEAFCEELVYRGYSKATIESNTQKVQFLIMFMATQGVTSSSDITIRHIENYLKTIENKAVKYVGVFLYVFRNFFSFLYERGYIVDDLAPMLPKVRTPRNASIPYVWPKDDIKKLLCAIDRDDPKGKRDYAILLIAIRLSSQDWGHQEP
jgi:integrase/recombinase XerD